MNTLELILIIQKALKLDRPLTLADTVDSVPQWDSIAQLAILIAIDKNTGGKASSVKGLAKCQTIQAFADELKKNGLVD